MVPIFSFRKTLSSLIIVDSYSKPFFYSIDKNNCNYVNTYWVGQILRQVLVETVL